MDYSETNVADQRLLKLNKCKKMKFKLASDLHLDEISDPINNCVLKVDDDADYIILAGDIGEKFSHVDYLKHISKSHSVIYVPGNHCYYGGRIKRQEQKLAERLQGHNVTILNKQVVQHENTVILGVTLWVDFTLFEGRVQEAKNDYDQTMRDRKKIKNFACRKWIANLVQREFHDNLIWLKQQLEIHIDKHCVVVTHHAPSLLSLPESLRGKIDAACYASNLDEFILQHPQIKVWCHGHIHQSSDYTIGNTRILCNPFKGMHFVPGWHNPDFNPSLHIELN